VDGCVPNFLRNYKWVMFQKWNWMGVVMSFTILVLQNFGRAMWQIKVFAKFLGNWLNHLSLLGACQCGWNSKGPYSVC